MAYFQSTAEFQEILGGFFRRLFEDPKVGPKLEEGKLKVLFQYSDPDLDIGVDTATKEVLIPPGPDFKPDVQMKMKADVAHRFWHGKVNLVMALARREMSAKGPIPKILKLLPAIKPAYELYPRYLEENGYGRLVIK